MLDETDERRSDTPITSDRSPATLRPSGTSSCLSFDDANGTDDVAHAEGRARRVRTRGPSSAASW